MTFPELVLGSVFGGNEGEGVGGDSEPAAEGPVERLGIGERSRIPRFGHDHQPLPVGQVDRERGHPSLADPRVVLHEGLHVLREVVHPAQDDEVAETPADEELVIDDESEVARPEPPAVGGVVVRQSGPGKPRPTASADPSSRGRRKDRGPRFHRCGPAATRPVRSPRRRSGSGSIPADARRSPGG
jgi:hypothetical protein